MKVIHKQGWFQEWKLLAEGDGSTGPLSLWLEPNGKLDLAPTLLNEKIDLFTKTRSKVSRAEAKAINNWTFDYWVVVGWTSQVHQFIWTTRPSLCVKVRQTDNSRVREGFIWGRFSLTCSDGSMFIFSSHFSPIYLWGQNRLQNEQLFFFFLIQRSATPLHRN